MREEERLGEEGIGLVEGVRGWFVVCPCSMTWLMNVIWAKVKPLVIH